MVSRHRALRTFITIVGAVVFICAGLTLRTSARISVNTIDTIATIADNGRSIIVTGPVQNDQVEWNDQQVTVTQRSTGAVAEGHARFVGTTTVQQWEVIASVKGSAAFEPGEATAVALCTSTLHGQVTDAHQWLVDITLVEEENGEGEGEQ